MPDHIPVLAEQVISYLNAPAGGTFLDGTLGLGGHTSLILNASNQNHVYGIDRDKQALEIARKNLEPFAPRFTLFHSDFKNLESLPIALDTIDGFLFDLGVSSFQLDDPTKGFTYAQNAPLDMRMNQDQQLTAFHVVNQYPFDRLSEIFRKYGEIYNPDKLVQQIVFSRKLKKIETTEQLKSLVRKIFPRQKTMDPLSRIFQAIRIEVNQELTGLDSFFLNLFFQMKPGARFVAISFHSLEDRIVKSTLKKARVSQLISILTKKPIIATEEEINSNPRARSAKLRAGEKI